MTQQVTTKKQAAQKMPTSAAKSSGELCSAQRSLPQLQKLIGNHSVLRHYSEGIQTKLIIGQPRDQYEMEAERIAEQVMRTPESSLVQGVALSQHVQPLRIHRLCTECKKKSTWWYQREESADLQAVDASCCASEVTPDLENQISGLQGQGQPLPTSVRRFFEPRFGYDFSQVRIHTDAGAVRLARAINARAFTLGREVVLGAGQYAPQTIAGKRLLAHELSHVVQQGGERRSGQGTAQRRLAPRIQRTRYTANCRQEQQASLGAAVRKARTDISQVSPQLTTSPLSLPVRNALWLAFRNESEDTAQEVHDKLGVIYRGLPGATIDCEQADELLYSWGCGGEDWAYTWRLWRGRFFGNIHVCMGAWSRRSPQQRSRIIAHESAHRFNGSEDVAYFTPDCQETSRTARLNSSARLNNADSYACFVSYLRDWPPDVLSQTVADLRGVSPVNLSQEPPGEIDLDSRDPQRPIFQVERSPGRPLTVPGFSYYWLLWDATENASHPMEDFLSGEPIRSYTPSREVATIGVRTREQLRARRVSSAEVRCFLGVPPLNVRMLTLPVRFTSTGALEE